MREKPSIDRRTVLLGGGGAIASLAGCISTSSTPPGSRGRATTSGETDESSSEQLKAGGSSTVYPITSKAASVWNSNPPADDEEYWGPSKYGIETDERLATYWAGKYGFEASGSTPPFKVNVGLSHSGTGLEKLKKGLVDIGNASAPVKAELPDLSQSELEKYTDHVVGVDAQPIVVSKEIREAGVDKLTAEQVRGIYTGEIENWSEIDAYSGEDKEIQAIGRAEGSGTDTAFRVNMLGGPDAKMAGVDVRKGQNQQVKTIVARSNNAIAYMALAFVTSEVAAIKLEFDGKVYEPGKNLADENYPLSRDLHCYTYEGTSEKEAAFLRMLISDFGQQNFVKPSGYAMLTDKRRKNQLGKLPDAK
ncbi:PstS family phosphate ABC transporter substrate-binding protein [Halorussus sp. MSC15.2]|uniref:PstS family phosphate ABC transporter substrate-binding protein n=1 Tax=Halorussus sp. MSC15.2 TaxID=2283638 RepID=UPI0013D52A0C|nr:PstS family phosphate ABC transporter substrate-binding protein [Halorussus sp. MSC15.2]NEU55977.1 PstS family phosphate ABC transporter substrate-binding protein [Halorussus sp. MSC15.2]